MKTKNNFLRELKSILDSANWDFVTCGNDNCSDVENKALPFLCRQKWSLKSIMSEIDDQFCEDFKYNVKTSHIKTHDECVMLCARMLADRLAYSRVKRYMLKGWRVDGINSKKWYINETVSFVLK